MRRLWNQCGRYRENLCLMASGALPEVERSEVQDHLAGCAGCRRYFEEIKSVASPLADWERNLAQVEPKEAMRARWARAIEAAGEPEFVHSRSSRFSLHVLWRELIWPCRRAWTGMAAVWLLMLWINLGLAEHRAASQLAGAKPESRTWQALAEQRRLLAELILPANSQPAEPPRRRESRPRSENRSSRDTACIFWINSPVTAEAVYPRDSVLDCASPLALSNAGIRSKSARGLAQSKTSLPFERFSESLT